MQNQTKLFQQRDGTLSQQTGARIGFMQSIRTPLRQMARNFLSTMPPEEAVLLAWPLVCGKEVAGRTRAVSFADGIFTAEVADPGWRTQLLSFVSRYIAGFNEVLGPVVQEVRFFAPSSVSAQSVKMAVKRP